MIQMMTAYTTEVDEIDDGMKEIFSQIDLNKLKKNTIGIITCHFDFTESGFIAELCKRLPFEVIGMTTMASSNVHGSSMYALSLTVLTSDDVVFETATTGPINSDNCREKITALCREIEHKLPGSLSGGQQGKQANTDSSLLIAFFPYLKNLSGAVMLGLLDEACGGTPIWGSLATNIDVSYEECHAFWNEDTGQDALVVVLLHGKIDPEFIVVSIPEQNIQGARGVITNSDGCILKEINGIPARKYIESLGVIIMENAPTVTPLLVYYEGSSMPVALGIYTVNEDGSMLCGGEMTIGATLAIGEINPQGIMASAAEGIQRLRQCGKKSGALFLPCVTRYIMLSPDQDSELKLISASMGGNMPYMAGYSGGEVCPVRDESGNLQNRFHNFTFSVCAF